MGSIDLLLSFALVPLPLRVVTWRTRNTLTQAAHPGTENNNIGTT
jgi:hypothetical protein